MYVADDIAIVLSAFLALNYSYNFIGDKVSSRAFQKSWEKEFLKEQSKFIEKHPDNTSDDYIHLGIQNRRHENLVNLCRQYYSFMTANYYINRIFQRFHPKIQITNYVGFRRTKTLPEPKPVRVEIIRCNKTYGLIVTQERANSFKNTAYALSKAKKPDDSLNGELFFIHQKHDIYEDRAHSEADQKEFENDFLIRNQEYLELHKDNLRLGYGPCLKVTSLFENLYKAGKYENVTIESNFNEEEIKRFKDVCKMFRTVWGGLFSKITEPSLEPTYLDFRRLDSNPGPVRVEMIQCAGKYAIMMAEKNRYVYLLTKGKRVKSLNANVFHIYANFPYRNKTPPPSTTDSSDDEVPSSRSSEKSCSAESIAEATAEHSKQVKLET